MEGLKGFISDLHKENSSVDNHYKNFKRRERTQAEGIIASEDYQPHPNFDACNNVSTAATY